VLAAMLLALGLLAALAVISAELPWWLSAPVALIATAYGHWLARSELRRPTRCLVIPVNEAATIDDQPMTDLELQWRGPLAFLQWRDASGRRRRLQGWPDVLGAAARRELRLAMAARAPARNPRSMAP
jgi:toxin CptA